MFNSMLLSLYRCTTSSTKLDIVTHDCFGKNFVWYALGTCSYIRGVCFARLAYSLMALQVPVNE